MFAAMKSGNMASYVPPATEPVPTSNGTYGQNTAGRKFNPQAKVLNIPEHTNEEDLKEFFSDIASVKYVKILPIREGRDTAMGFVDFETDSDVQKAVEEKNGVEFNGSKLRVFECNQSGGSGSGGGSGYNNRRDADTNNNHNSRLQVKVFNIPDGTDETELKEFFSEAGSVTKVHILPCREGKEVTLGFVHFETSESLEKAVDMYQDRDFKGSKLRVMDAAGGGNSGGFGRYGGNLASLEQRKPLGRGEQLLNNVKYFSKTGEGMQRTRDPPRLYNQHNDYWNGGPSQPTSRIPREERERNGDSNGDIQFDANFVNGGMNGPIMDDEIQRMPPVTYIPPPPPETEDEIFEQKSHEGINFDKYENIPVKITGNNPVQPISDFKDAKLHIVCNKNIMRAKYHKPTPVQKYAIPAVLSKRDLMACAQTGSGKTASFLLPVITSILNDQPLPVTPMDGPVCPLALIVAPTRELATQIFTEARKFSYESELKPVVVYGGVSVNHQLDILRRGCHICIATPGRLHDFIRRGKLSFRNLKFMIFDEADRMLDMGFGPQIDGIVNDSEMPPKDQRTTLMFSATFPDEIQQMALKFLNDYLFLTVGRVGGACSDVQQTILQIQSSEKREKLEEILHTSGTDRTLVFVERKKDADFLATYLSQRDCPATSLNGDRSQQEREAALADFRRGNAPVLVATAVAGRGLDIDDVKHVINYDLPKEPTEYVHRIGRTGRIGNKGKATSFFDGRRDQGIARPIVKMLSEAEQNVPDWLEKVAMEAIGTGYGQDKGNYRDRRGGGYSSPGEGYGGAVNNRVRSPPSGNGNTKIYEQDDEEW